MSQFPPRWLFQIHSVDHDSKAPRDDSRLRSHLAEHQISLSLRRFIERQSFHQPSLLIEERCRGLKMETQLVFPCGNSGGNADRALGLRVRETFETQSSAIGSIVLKVQGLLNTKTGTSFPPSPFQDVHCPLPPLRRTRVPDSQTRPACQRRARRSVQGLWTTEGA